MLRFTMLCLCAGLCLAQTPSEKPPAEVDQALRARVNEFFQDLVDGSFRKAEALVAEDSKDIYYNLQKTRYRSFKLKDIEYSDNFTRAKATSLVETEVPIAGFAGQVITVPVPSRWKIENGAWCWYVDPLVARQTPFGRATPGPGSRPSSVPAVMDLSVALHKIKADKSALNLKAGESGEVTLTNTAPGKMTISLVGEIPGADVKLDRMNLDAGAKAVLSIQTHDGAQSGTLTIKVEPTNEVIPIQVSIE